MPMASVFFASFPISRPTPLGGFLRPPHQPARQRAGGLAVAIGHGAGFSDLDLASAIERLLQIDTLVVDSEKEVWEAAAALRDGQASFANALICFLGREAGCSHTVTFDRKAL